jgi:hypothetical protein
METHVKRTLVKSAPELWELADDPVKMQLWMASLTASPRPIEVEVTHRDPKRVLAWQTGNGGPFARIAVELTEKGFGTSVRISATHEDAGNAEGALEALLDELGAPERRPFANA